MEAPLARQALVTGATGGIGKEIARGLLRAGFDLVLSGRDRQRGLSALAELRAEAPLRQVDLVLADLSSLREAQRLAEEVSERLPLLSVLVNNAGAYFASRQLTPEGIEQTFALNHLGPFVLTQRLLALLKRNAPARVITVSSDFHHAGRMDFDDLQFEHRAWLGGWPAYAQSKVANILFTRELARRLEGTGVTANVMHPGMTASGFGRNNPGFWKSVVAGTQLFARTPRKAAETALYLATSAEVAGESGRYFYDCHPSRAAARAVDSGAADRLWRVSEALVGKVLGAP